MEHNSVDLRAYSEVKSVMGEVMGDLINTFIDYLPEQLDALSTAIEQGDAENVFGIAHRIKSSSNSLGALGLAETAASIEQIGRSGATEGADQQLPLLRQQLDEAIAFLTEEREAL